MELSAILAGSRTLECYSHRGVHLSHCAASQHTPEKKCPARNAHMLLCQRPSLPRHEQLLLTTASTAKAVVRPVQHSSCLSCRPHPLQHSQQQDRLVVSIPSHRQHREHWCNNSRGSIRCSSAAGSSHLPQRAQPLLSICQQQQQWCRNGSATSSSAASISSRSSSTISSSRTSRRISSGNTCSSKTRSSRTNSSRARSSMGKASTSLSRRLHAYVSGNVQGVFFRSYTKAKAMELGLTGWVRNRRDGRVEVMAEGYDSDLQQLLTWLHTGSPQADVSGVDASWGPATGEFDDFDTLWTV